MNTGTKVKSTSLHNRWERQPFGAANLHNLCYTCCVTWTANRKQETQMKLSSNQLNALKTIRRTLVNGVGRTTDVRAAKGLEKKGIVNILTLDGANVSDHRGIAGNCTGTRCARCEIV
jgi:hypothetical protein